MMRLMVSQGGFIGLEVDDILDNDNDKDITMIRRLCEENPQETFAAFSDRFPRIPRRFYDVLREYGFRVKSEECRSVAGEGDTEMLSRLRENGAAQLGVDCCESAAANNQLQCLRWLHEDGAPWDASTCAAATAKGYFLVLQYALRNGCPWDWRSVRNAADQVDNHSAFRGRECLIALREDTIERPERLAEWPENVHLGKRTLAIIEERVAVKRLVVSIFRGLPQKTAATVIQKRWLQSYYNPKHPICRRRLLREHASMTL